MPLFDNEQIDGITVTIRRESAFDDAIDSLSSEQLLTKEYRQALKWAKVNLSSEICTSDTLLEIMKLDDIRLRAIKDSTGNKQVKVLLSVL